MRFTKNFELEEFTHSDVAVYLKIDNTPNETQIASLKLLCEDVLQPARDISEMYIHVNSGFRSDLLNKKIGGSKTSQHPKGEAADIKCIDNAKLFEVLKRGDFDQLIWEFGNEKQPKWIHVSHKKIGNRKEVLKAVKVNGVTKYLRI